MNILPKEAFLSLEREAKSYLGNTTLSPGPYRQSECKQWVSKNLWIKGKKSKDKKIMGTISMSIKCIVFNVNEIIHLGPVYLCLKKTKYPLPRDICVTKVRNVLSTNTFLIISETWEMKRETIHFSNSNSKLFFFQWNFLCLSKRKENNTYIWI